MHPLLHGTLTMGLWVDNPFVRGFVSGFGVIHLIIGVREIVRLARARRARNAQ